MKFYRSFSPFKLISFDLDDTLYDNHPVICRAEKECIEFLRKVAEIPHLDEIMWRSYRQRIAQQDPMLTEDVTTWRTLAIQLLLQEQSKRAGDFFQVSAEAMQHFLYWRHQIDLPPQNLDVLNQLKTRYQLVAITNGNVDPKRIGLTQFDLILTAGKQGRAKPHADLFLQAARHFNLPPQQILHIGDNLNTDVQGAIQAGCQAVWLNPSEKSVRHFSDSALLPTMEIAELGELLQLL